MLCEIVKKCEMSELNMNSSVELCMTVASSGSELFDRDEIVRLLTTADADINFQDANRNFNTPLHLAIENRNEELIKLLLCYKPNLRTRNINGERPKDLAMNLSLFEVVKILNEHRTSSSKEIKFRPHYVHDAPGNSGTSNNEKERTFPSNGDASFESRRSDKIYASSRVQFLLSISKIDPHFKRTNFNLELLRKIYSQIDENDSLRPLIKVAKEMPWLEIYYIYNQSKEAHNERLNCSLVSSAALNNETIFISGLQSGTKFTAHLLHQLMHRVLNLVHDNECKPYRRKQAEKMIRFRKIITIYKNRQPELHHVVRSIFELPNSELWDAELIACVPFLIASCQLSNDEHLKQQERSTELKEIIQSHKDLFDFYNDVVLKDIDDFLVRSNLKKFKERPVEGSSFGRRRGSDPYRIEKMEENYGNDLRHNKRHNKALQRVCAIS